MLRALYTSTLRALLAPRRGIPIVLVCVPMVVAQARFSAHGMAALVAVLVCLLFVAIGPFAWRALFPRGRPHTLLALRLLAYGLLGGLPALVGWALPELFHLGSTFIATGVNLLVASALFWVGGWGLARDIEFEEGLREARARADALALEAERAQLLALRAHLDPHFLFNTLNAIAEWCRQDGVLAEQAILKLSALLRQIFTGVRAAAWPLQREIELLRDLFELHRIRDPERFVVEWALPEPLPPVELPPLLLLPLAENAVKHGPAQGHSGSIVVELSDQGEALELRLGNPGPYQGPRDGGEGLDMVRRRLALAYGERATFAIAGRDQRTEVLLTLPRSGPDGVGET